MAGLSAMKPQVSRVTKTLDNFVCTIYGLGGLGKTPVATKMPKPIYFAFGKSGLSGLNNVPFYPIKSWAEFRKYVKFFSDPKNYDELKEDVQTLVFDELEILWTYCENYVSSTNGVNKIKEGNGGFGLWKDLKEEWEDQILKLIGSGFSVMFILHASANDEGKMFPVGDAKRMLPILINHSDVIGYVKSNGVDADGKPQHSSLVLADCDKCFARTRNEYISGRTPIIEDFTAENLIKAYYEGIEAQSEAEGVATVSKEEQDALYAVEKIPFAQLQEKANKLCAATAQKHGKEVVLEVIEKILGQGNTISKCTEKQYEAVEAIVTELESL